MAQISRVGRIWWRNLRREVTPSLYWKLHQIHSSILSHIEFKTHDQNSFFFFSCLQFNHVYQYLLNNVSFGISTYVCICFSTFEDGEAWYRVSTVELEVKARFQPFPFLLLWTDGNFFPHSFTNLYLIQKYIKSPAKVNFIWIGVVNLFRQFWSWNIFLNCHGHELIKDRMFLFR